MLAWLTLIIFFLLLTERGRGVFYVGLYFFLGALKNGTVLLVLAIIFRMLYD